MCDQPGSSKRLNAMPYTPKKRKKSSDYETEDSDEFYFGRDIDDVKYECISENSSDFELNLKQDDDVSEEQSLDRSSARPISPANCATPFAITVSPTQCSLDQPTHTVSKWSNDFSSMRKIPYSKTNSLLTPEPKSPRSYFDMFINTDYLQKIVDFSNRYADYMRNSSNQLKSRITQWKPLTVEELKIFIGLLLHTSTAKMNRIVDYWKIHRLYKSVFPLYMSRNRFQIILRCLHFVDEETNTDRISKCKLVIDNFNNVMETIYYPGKDLSIDESMTLWHKYGIKLFLLSEPNGIILNIRVFASTLDVTGGKGHTDKIVEELLQGKLNAGHAVFMNNFYINYDLAFKLLEQDTYSTGILNKKCKDNLCNIITKNIRRGENVSQCRSGVHIGKWKDKKEINYITTEFPDEVQKVITRRGNVTTKPAAVINYNKNMSRIDLQDQMLSYYPCERKTFRWYIKILVHTLMMSLNNARVLYNKYSNGKSMTLYDFREKIIESYLPEINSEQPTQKACENLQQHKLTKLDKAKPRFLSNGKTVNVTSRKDCRNCYKNKRRVNTTTECKICSGSPPLCMDCFFELHNCTAR